MTTLEVGARLQGSSRTITDAEISLLPSIMGVTSPLFHDEETARKGPLGRRVLYGPALLGIAVAGTEFLLHGKVIGLIGLTDVRFRQTVGVGDTITPYLNVEERILKPEKAGDLLIISDEVFNQEGATVLEFRRTVMVRRLDQ
ncbi:MAG TPA: MaoC/PaaZ C-terminal domain-containing protein [Acidimicrobiales bacterium]|jgi:acyl dehydratase|nr:MaoC/PaaZ C-terminal domain-containing protein [Acidimicrobiales bacterium]